MKNIIRLIVVLTIICAASGSLMAIVNDMTKERIAAANEAAKVKAMESVLPAFDNNPIEDTKTFTSDGKEYVFYIARQEGAFVGAAFVSTSPEGYGGNINVMAGINQEGCIQSIEILAPLQETPGLGAKITEPKFKSGLIGKDIRTTNWKVAKDGGDVDHVTAATISSRAVVNAVSAGIDVFIANEEEIKQ